MGCRSARERKEPVGLADPRVTRAADEELVKSLRAGDEDAVEELVGRYGARLPGCAQDYRNVCRRRRGGVGRHADGLARDRGLSR
jgi:hypothetical protein